MNMVMRKSEFDPKKGNWNSHYYSNPDFALFFNAGLQNDEYGPIRPPFLFYRPTIYFLKWAVYSLQHKKKRNADFETSGLIWPKFFVVPVKNIRWAINFFDLPIENSCELQN